MNTERLCPKNFQVWVAFLMGMVVIIIAIVLFDNVLNKSRVGMNPDVTHGAEVDTKSVDISVTTPFPQTVSSMTESSDDRAWLGIEPVDITEEMAKQLDISRGVLISKVIEDSPAEKAGLLRGDILYEFDHREVKDTDHLTTFIQKLEPGERVKIGLFRNDDRLVFYVYLGERQSISNNTSVLQVSGTSSSDQQWGIVISELVPTIRSTYGIPDFENGVIVLMVIPGTPADLAGIRKGDLIRNVNQVKINHMSDFFQAIQAADSKMVLNIFRQGSDLMIVVSSIASINEPAGPGVVVAQEGIGMNRPLYVPGYDQTQSGEPETKTTTNTSVTF